MRPPAGMPLGNPSAAAAHLLFAAGPGAMTPPGAPAVTAAWPPGGVAPAPPAGVPTAAGRDFRHQRTMPESMGMASPQPPPAPVQVPPGSPPTSPGANRAATPQMMKSMDFGLPPGQQPLSPTSPGTASQLPRDFRVSTAGQDLAFPVERPMFLTADPKDPLTMKIQHSWHDASDVVDGILRGPADHIMRDPDKARCRLCGQSLTGNMVADQMAVANHRLVTAMDYAWSVCDKFYCEKVELQKRALAKRREVEELANLANALRTEYPSQVHGYVMRTMHEPRERLARVKQELEDLHSVDGLGHGWEATAGIDPPFGNPRSAAQALVGDIVDVQWYRFRESVDKRVALCSLHAAANVKSKADSEKLPKSDLAQAVEAQVALPAASAAFDGLAIVTQDYQTPPRNGLTASP